MSERPSARDLLRRYLRQQLELGQGDLYLEESSQSWLDRLGARQMPVVESELVPPTGGDRHSGSATPPSGPDVAKDVFGELRSEVLGCTRCRLAGSRRTVVFGEGDRSADLLVVGEAPGVEEDRSGRPFVGPAGQLLDKMLAAIGFRRDEVFICNVLKCRPPSNRDPLADEVASCRPYLRRQVELIEPKAVCAFGRFAAQTLVDRDVSLGKLRGATHDFMGIPVVATYHPAALLRNTQWKRPAWDDLKLLRRVYDEAGGRPPGGESA